MVNEWKIAKIQAFLKSPEGEFLLSQLKQSAYQYQTVTISDISKSWIDHKNTAMEAYMASHRRVGMLLMIELMEKFGEK